MNTVFHTKNIGRAAAIAMLVVAAAAGGLTQALAQTEGQQSALPGGPTSLTETYDDWQVICSVGSQNTPNCSMLQQQVNGQGQRLMAIEMRPNGATMTGTLVMPFGLALPAGVRLQVDELQGTTPATFATCLYDGCLVPFSLDETQTAGLRAGTALKVLAVGNDGSEVALTVSLRGVSRAADRTAALMVPTPQ